MEDGAREAGDWALYPASSRRSPAPTGFFSVPFPPPVRFGLLPFCVRGQANLLFQSSCFNVLVTLPPPLDPPPPSLPAFPGPRGPGSSGPPMLRVPFTAQQNEPPKHQLIFQEATSASAATPRHLVDPADPAEDLNSGWESSRDFFQDRLIAISRFRRILYRCLAFPSYAIGARLD